MKQVLFLIITIQFSNTVFAQKKLLDFSVYDSWDRIEDQKISNDGNYIVYMVKSPTSSPTMIVRSTANVRQKEIKSIIEASFTDDSRRIVFLNSMDSLGILTLGSNNVQFIPDIISYKISKGYDCQWIACQIKGKNHELYLYNLVTGRQRLYAEVLNFSFSGNGNTLLLQTKLENDSVASQSLNLINLTDGRTKQIWEGNSASNQIFDINGAQLVFMTNVNVLDPKTMTKENKSSIWYYKTGMDQAIFMADDNSVGTNNELKLDRIAGFSKDGKNLFFSVRGEEHPKPLENTVKVDIWHYRDIKLQSQQIQELTGHGRSFISSINLKTKSIIRLEFENEQINGDLQDVDDTLVIIKRTIGDIFEYGWNPNAITSLFLENINDGTRKIIKQRIIPRGLADIKLSPKGKYIVYYDIEKKNYFSFNVQNGSTFNITERIPFPLYNKEDDWPGSGRAIASPVWIEKDAWVLIHDEYDIWQVDPAGIKVPINITEFYGRQHKTILRIIQSLNSFDSKITSIKYNEYLLFVAFNKGNKGNGFFKKQLGNKGQPKLLTMGSYIYHYPFSSWEISTSPPLKAKNKILYLVQRMTSSEAPNLFISKDLSHFKQVSNLHPQENYNWLTAEIVRWKMFNDSIGEGILYKPENFDLQKKYPLILNFYERNADEVNNFKYPNLSEGDLDIPYFVSNGYLVFYPNIYYKLGHTGESAYNSILSAAKYLAAFPWVDSTKIGLQGMSFGGYEVNYVIAHSNYFAAAAETAGMVDFVSAYGDISSGGISNQFQFELMQNRIGSTLWESPKIYVQNSPIFSADKINTPLLIMHNKGDQSVSFTQGVELFTALRRLGKKTWMLQYDEEGHGLFQKANQLDYSKRLSQYFDHYLKGVAPPKWMTQGVHAADRGINTGLELDYSGAVP